MSDGTFIKEEHLKAECGACLSKWFRHAFPILAAPCHRHLYSVWRRGDVTGFRYSYNLYLCAAELTICDSRPASAGDTIDVWVSRVRTNRKNRGQFNHTSLCCVNTDFISTALAYQGCPKNVFMLKHESLSLDKLRSATSTSLGDTVISFSSLTSRDPGEKKLQYFTFRDIIGVSWMTVHVKLFPKRYLISLEKF